MNRRDFSLATGALSTAVLSSSLLSNAFAQAQTTAQQVIELRRYDLVNWGQRGAFNAFMEKAAIPAWNRIGINPVGAFTVTHGESLPSVYVLLPHPGVESVLTADRKLLEDDTYRKEGKDFLDVAMANPSYLRIRSTLMLGFKDMPKVAVPKAIQGKDSRIFELRIYESHNEIAAKKKIEMFNEGGEIAIFNKVGLDPVFFGEAISGERLPNLHYMLGFADMAAKDQAWDNFRKSPDWAELSRNEEYKDTVSNITDLILRPAGYSQI